MMASLCPITHWRHGSKAPLRELTRDEKRARRKEMKASHKRVALSRRLRPAKLASEAFYRSLLSESYEQVAPGLTRYRDGFEQTARCSPFLGLLAREASRA